MTRTTFFQHFDLLADQPDAVAKMRELVLELAVRGKLVRQNSNDQPASKLLKEIETEKRRIAEVQGLSLPKESFEIEASELPHALPSGWEWVRFGQIAQHNSGKTLDKSRNKGHSRDYITTSNLYWGTFELRSLRQMLIRDEELERCTARKGDLLICEGGEAGRAAVWPYDREVAFQNHVHRARFHCGIDSYYAYRFFQKLNATGEIHQYRKGVGILSMSSKSLASVIFPLPPLAEQRRIVAKVDELMALCDELAARQQARHAARAQLQQSALHHLLAAREPQTFAAAWPRVRDHFHLLHDTPDALPQLRQAILQLAVQGKLVPQDANGAQACEISDAVTSRSGILQKKSEPPFNLPGSWHWKQLGQVSELINGDRSKNYPNKEEYVRDGVAWINTGHIEPDGTLSLESMHYITRAKFDSLRSGKIKPDDLVYCLRGATLGKTAIISQFKEGAVASSLVIIRLSDSVNPKYAYYFLTSPLGRQQIWQFDNGSAQPNLSADSVKKYWFPLPPMAEQARIVARLEELLRQCDALEAQLRQTRTLGAHLLDSTLHHLLAA